jgi:pyrimidine-nucleoside phosphorylase
MKIHNSVDIIKKKRDGGILSEEEVSFFISSYVEGSISDYHTSALLMAIYFRGLNEEETLHFTKAYINSGETVDLSFIKKPKVDKHSTGGVGDKTSIILAPLLASMDVVVPMMSGRGLGHTGGTLDKLESIPGFRVHLTVKEFKEILGKVNACMIGQTDSLTPADKKIYALRDVTATVENISLITASITSKKIAEGAEAVVYDVKVGNGSTLPTMEKSRELASHLLSTSGKFGQKAIAVLTEMDSPLGCAIGNWLEIKECVMLMNPKIEDPIRSKDLKEVTLFLAGAMLQLAGKCKSIEKGAELAGKNLINGKCMEKFIEMVEIQGGDSSIIKDLDKYAQAKFRDEFKAIKDGFIESQNAYGFGSASVNLGCGRGAVHHKIDYSSGIILEKKVGDKVKKGDVVCRIFGESEAKIQHAISNIEKAVGISNEPVEVKSKIIEVID